jgi:integrase/recombinase XerD
MSDQPDLIGLKMGEFQQKNEDAEKLCRESRDHYLFSTQKNSHFTANTATQHLQRLYARAGTVGATKLKAHST